MICQRQRSVLWMYGWVWQHSIGADCLLSMYVNCSQAQFAVPLNYSQYDGHNCFILLDNGYGNYIHRIAINKKIKFSSGIIKFVAYYQNDFRKTLPFQKLVVT